MKIRTICFKVDDPSQSARFWSDLFDIQPHKQTGGWVELMIGQTRLGFLKNDFGDQFTGAGCFPVFEFADDVIEHYIKKATTLGATIIVDGVNDPKLNGVVFKAPDGHEFELTRFHDE